MATVRMESYDGSVRDLPDVCMKCGAPATVRKHKTFSWYPPWLAVLLLAGLLPYIIVVLILTKKSRVEVPLCDAHKHHWLMRQALVLVSLLGLLAVGFVAVLLTTDGRADSGPFGFVCMGWVLLMIAWIVMASIVQFTSIRPQEITDTSVTLMSVSPLFAEAYEEEDRTSPERLDELASERWNQGKRRSRGDRPFAEDADRIQRAEEDEDRRSPPDTYQL